MPEKRRHAATLPKKPSQSKSLKAEAAQNKNSQRAQSTAQGQPSQGTKVNQVNQVNQATPSPTTSRNPVLFDGKARMEKAFKSLRKAEAEFATRRDYMAAAQCKAGCERAVKMAKKIEFLAQRWEFEQATKVRATLMNLLSKWRPMLTATRKRGRKEGVAQHPAGSLVSRQLSLANRKPAQNSFHILIPNDFIQGGALAVSVAADKQPIIFNVPRQYSAGNTLEIKVDMAKLKIVDVKRATKSLKKPQNL